jgi:hypothetical protein
MTSLMLACKNKNTAAAAELMEATKNAGALDLKVNVVWSVSCEGCRQVVGAGAGKGERRGGRGICAGHCHMRVRASTGLLRELGDALCKQGGSGEHGSDAAVALRRCRNQRQGTGMLTHVQCACAACMCAYL